VDRGDIYYVDLNPIQGREQAGARYVLIVSTLSGAGTQTQGVVLCDQPRVLDLQARKAQFVERVPAIIMDEVLAKLSTLIE
jgi:mRNA-degrading endonuclease toxin of MazEF toxin-antitoxin module